jgi:EAL domain
MSMLPVIRPDVIKLDLKVTQSTPSSDAMRVLHLVYEEVERTGATILAEGVETKRHDQVVRALGAPLAQGWLYGKPTDDPTPAEEHAQEHESHMSLWAGLGLEDVRSPFEVLGGHPISRAPRDLLLSLADEVFRHGLHLLPPALLVVLVPDPEALTKHHLRVLSQLARGQVITGVIGAGMPAEPAPGVRGSQKHDPALDGQYAVIAVSPSTAVAVLARQAHSAQPDFYFGIIHDRPRITTAARCLLRQLGPQPAGG